MSDLCPNCGQKTNSSFSRLVKDACGHMKCRMCLLYEEQGCESCRKTSNGSGNNEFTQNICNNIHEQKKDNVENFNQKCDGDNANLKTLNLLKSELEINENRLQNSSDVNDKNGLVKLKHININILNEEQEDKLKPKQYHNKSHIIIIPDDPERYQCIVCKKVFKNKKCIHYHNACATGIKPFQCTICEKSFVNRSHFEYHERSHTGYKPFKCNLCDKAFPQRNKLNRHMISHGSQKKFACSKCDKKYSKKSDLQSHLYIHLDIINNVYTCKSCEKTFVNLTHLKRHARAHSNERPHICEHCKKTFKDKSLLVRHYKTHGKERPFICAHCSRGFLTKSELRRHLTVHSDEKPFSCNFCQTVFRRKDNLNRHIRHHHSEDERSNNKNHSKITEKINLKKSLLLIEQKMTKSKLKCKKSISRIQNKGTKIACINSQKQINSRLDPMGNITTVIRTTGEVSNAVPVINGPTINRYEESNNVPKKTLTYMEPIPPAEAVVINKRIEAKLYPQSNISQNYFFHEFSNSNDNNYLGSSSLVRSSVSNNNRSLKCNKETNSFCDAFNCNENFLKNSFLVPDNIKQLTYVDESESDICYDNIVQTNCVSTIKKHIMQSNF